MQYVFLIEKEQREWARCLRPVSLSFLTRNTGWIDSVCSCREGWRSCAYTWCQAPRNSDELTFIEGLLCPSLCARALDPVV